MRTNWGKKCRDSNQRGFTVLEVLISIVVVSIGLLSLSMMQIQAIRGNRLARMSTQATFLAQHMLERIKDGNIAKDGIFGFMDMSVIEPGVVLGQGALFGITQEGENGGPFNLQWQVTANTNWSRGIAVKVSWYGVGRARQLSLSSISRGNGT